MRIILIIDVMNATKEWGGHLHDRLIHIGTVTTEGCPAVYFEELGIPDPNINLEIGSGTPVESTDGILA